ncbi:MAG: hypothetical protein M3410_05975 [Acidobacteriota bacterium]|nr:hypothetical protein [Acidobacteriota bacterium]
MIATCIGDLLNEITEIPELNALFVCDFFSVGLPSPSYDDLGIIPIDKTVPNLAQF